MNSSCVVQSCDNSSIEGGIICNCEDGQLIITCDPLGATTSTTGKFMIAVSVFFFLRLQSILNPSKVLQFKFEGFSCCFIITHEYGIESLIILLYNNVSFEKLTQSWNAQS